jgi:hypothetical protein
MHKQLICVALALCAKSAAAQKAPVTVSLQDGRQIYVSGLRRWTVDMVQDSLLTCGSRRTLPAFTFVLCGLIRYHRAPNG